ncbi:hypothetical protein [Pandoraea pnomenusa]|nr:hypothetical protein [Pandoraea pnomenusa]
MTVRFGNRRTTWLGLIAMWFAVLAPMIGQPTVCQERRYGQAVAIAH